MYNMLVTSGLHTQREEIMWIVPLQIKGSSGLLNKLTLTGEDSDFLLRRQQALEVRISGPCFYIVYSTTFSNYLILNCSCS